MNSRTPTAALLLATSLWVGYMPIAPGTWGSAVGVILHLVLHRSLGSVMHALLILGMLLAGVWAAGVVERTSARKDPSIVVIDEVVGMLLAFYGVPVSVWGLAAGFFVFRLLDVVKPFPCRRAEHAPGGWGIMTDDAIAGVYTNVVLRLAAVWLPALLVR